AIGGGQGRQATGPPYATRRYLHQRQQIADRPCQGRGITVWPALAEQQAELLSCPWLLLDGAPAGSGQLSEVQTGDLWRVGGVAAQIAVHYGLDEGPQRQAVGSRDEVDGVAHQRDADDEPLRDELCKRARGEGIEPAPQREVGLERHLRLNADQMIDRVNGPS